MFKDLMSKYQLLITYFYYIVNFIKSCDKLIPYFGHV